VCVYIYIFIYIRIHAYTYMYYVYTYISPSTYQITEPITRARSIPVVTFFVEE